MRESLQVKWERGVPQLPVGPSGAVCQTPAAAPEPSPTYAATPHLLLAAADRGRRRPQPVARGVRRCQPAKTMLARRPADDPARAMTRAQAIEVTRIHSVAGIHGDGLIGTRARSARPTNDDLRRHWRWAEDHRRATAKPRWLNHGVLFYSMTLSEFQRSSHRRAAAAAIEDGASDHRSRSAGPGVPDPGSCSSRPRIPARAGLASWASGACAASPILRTSSPPAQADRCWTVLISWVNVERPAEHELRAPPRNRFGAGTELG